MFSMYEENKRIVKSGYIKRNMKYKCTLTSGGGTESDGGEWELKETDKTISFTQTKESFFNPPYIKILIRKFYKDKKPAWRNNLDYIGYMNNGHCLRAWEDGTYTAYPNQCGTPYYFEPLFDKTTIPIYNVYIT